MRYRWHIVRALGGSLALVGGCAALHAAVLRGGEANPASGASTGGGARESLVAAAVDALDPTGLDAELHLRVPAHEPLLVPPRWKAAPAVRKGVLRAHAFQYVSRVFNRPGRRPHARGFVRRGTVLTATRRVPGRHCAGGWYALAQGGVVCAGDGFVVTSEPRGTPHQRKPDVTRALPFRYAKVTRPEALRFYRLPSADEQVEIARARSAGQRLPEIVERRLDGIYLLALDGQASGRHEQAFQRTVRGRYVRARNLEPKLQPKMRGVLLGGEKRLPYAFVFGREAGAARLYRVAGDGRSLELAGVADNHARIRVLRELTVAGRELVVGPEGLALGRDQVRVARQTARPGEVPRGAKWMHVDLAEQVLVAYEGDRPVFATLVSSGKGGEYATPTGLYRIGEKHISTTMRGADPDEGVYEVEEVPWTQYYHDSYAIHGAYWHDSFGEVRSHGCTNLSPVDARWLFYWSDGVLPAGWNALRNFQGTYVYVTDEQSA